MTLKLTTSLSSTITKSELESNFTSIQSKFAGAIDNSDIKTGAGIDITKLSAYKEYVVVTLSTGGDAQGFDTADQYRDFVPLPGLSASQATWTLAAASWICTDVGTASTAKFDVEWCEYDANGNFVVVSTPINEETLTKGSSTITNAKQCTVDSSSIAFDGSLSRFFALKVDTVHADALDSADAVDARIVLKVSLLLERNIQA